MLRLTFHFYTLTRRRQTGGVGLLKISQTNANHNRSVHLIQAQLENDTLLMKRLIKIIMILKNICTQDNFLKQVYQHQTWIKTAHCNCYKVTVCKLIFSIQYQPTVPCTVYRGD